MAFYNFGWAEDTLSTARNIDNGKPVANNTRLYQRGEDSIAVRLHNTDVVTMHRDGTFTLAAGGYHTVTTMQRIRAFSPAQLFSERGEWYLWTEENPRDPKPERVDRSVCKPYEATDPGEEPVKSELGCQAGSMIGTDHSERRVWRKDMIDGDVIIDSEGDSDYSYVTVARKWTSWVFYGAESQSWANDEWRKSDKTDVTYEQCPHCKAFDAEHERRRFAMHGERWGRRYDRNRGYALYAANMQMHGSMEAWQEAYITDFRARRAYLKALREWEQRNRVPFYDGIVVNSEGYAPKLRNSGPSPAKLRRHQREVAKVKKQIDKYVNGFVAELQNGMPMPSGGDCWYCLMTTEDGTTWGDMGDNDHLWNHMEERYYVPSLAVNALRERGYRDVGIMMWLDMNQDTNTMGGGDRYDNVKRDLVKYMRKRLVPAAPTE